MGQGRSPCQGAGARPLPGFGAAPQAQRRNVLSIKRANSPQGYEARGGNALQNRAYNHSPATAKMGQGRSPCQGAGARPLPGVGAAPQPQRRNVLSIKRANSPQGYEASGTSTLQNRAYNHSPAAAKMGQGRSPCQGAGARPLPGFGAAPQAQRRSVNQQVSEQPAGL